MADGRDTSTGPSETGAPRPQGAAARTGARRRLAAGLRRVGSEAGFGLIELLVAMTVLNIGIFAVFAGFSSGYSSINRAKLVSSATAIESAQMERFRALRFSAICLSTTSSDTTYIAGAPAGTAVPSCGGSDPALVAVRAPATGPDGRAYRVDTHIVWACTVGTLTVSGSYTTSEPGCVTSGFEVSTAVKLIRVTVRDHANTARLYTTQESTFDASTGL